MQAQSTPIVSPPVLNLYPPEQPPVPAELPMDRPAAPMVAITKRMTELAVSNNGTSRNLVEAVYHYNPTAPAAVAAAAVYISIGILLLFPLVRRKNWWGLCLPIGAFCSGIGYICRLLLRHTPTSVGLFAITQTFLICSPAAYLAFNYIVLGRLITATGTTKRLFIRPTSIAKVFVISDISTFLLQAAGGSLETNQSLRKVGSNILLIGVILQMLSYILFGFLAVKTQWDVRSSANHKYSGKESWRRVFALLYFSSVFIVIRLLYRTIELAQGDGGFLLTHEVYFYIFDALPLVVAIAIYIPFWPSKYWEATSEIHDLEDMSKRSSQATRH